MLKIQKTIKFKQESSTIIHHQTMLVVEEGREKMERFNKVSP
jgi:hypothetical protein